MEKLFPQKLLHGVLTVILAVGGTVAIASEAEAAPYCPSGATCLWRDGGYSGGGGSINFYRYIPDLASWTFPDGSGANDAVSSAFCNGRYEYAFIYEKSWGNGARLDVRRQEGRPHLTANRFNDVTSSAYFSGYTH